MSYYNDYALVVDQKAGALLDSKLKVLNRELVELFIKHTDHYQVDKETKCRFYFWKDVKSTEEEFEFLKFFTYDLDVENYRFIRLGESYGDIEVEGDLECIEFNLSLNTEIKFNKVTK